MYSDDHLLLAPALEIGLHGECLLYIHGRLQDFFQGEGELGGWDRSPPAGSRSEAAAEVWEQSPQKLTTCFENNA